MYKLTSIYDCVSFTISLDVNGLDFGYEYVIKGLWGWLTPVEKVNSCRKKSYNYWWNQKYLFGRLAGVSNKIVCRLRHQSNVYCGRRRGYGSQELREGQGLGVQNFSFARFSYSDTIFFIIIDMIGCDWSNVIFIGIRIGTIFIMNQS